MSERSHLDVMQNLEICVDYGTSSKNLTGITICSVWACWSTSLWFNPHFKSTYYREDKYNL